MQTKVKPRWKTIVWTIVKIALVVGIVYFLLTQIDISFAQIADYLINANIYFYESLSVFTLFLMMQAWIWVQILNRPTWQLSSVKGMMIYINSQFAKYLPGGIWNYVGRVMMTSREGVSMQRQLLTIFYENLLLVLAASVYAIALIYSLNWIPFLGIIGAVVLTSLFYVYYDAVTNVLEKFVHRYIKKFRGVSLKLARKDFFTLWFYFLLSHFVMGISYWLLIRSFGIHDVGFVYAAGTFALAWLVGLLSPLPGGIGVREGLLIYLLSFHMDVATATQISIITRIWNIMSELIFFGLINGFAALRKGWRKI